MDIDAMLDMAKDILPDAPELIGSLSEILPEPSQKLLAMALKLLFASIGMARGERDKKALTAVGQDIAEQLPAETAEELRAFCRQFQEDEPIIPPEYRKRYLETVLEKYPDFPNKPQLYNAFSVCVSKLEEAIRQNCSQDGHVLLRQVMLTRTDIDALKHDIAELLDQSRPKQNFTTSNQDYKEIFEEPLFLHKGNREVCLRNLFVPHRFRGGRVTNESMDAYLARFVRDEKAQFLFIEGDAGCGKSSLTAYLSWHYERRDETAAKIFGDAQLMTVRLRNIDVPTGGRKDEHLTIGVLRFLYGDKESDRDIMRRFRESGARVLLLDGYDELCTTDGIEEPEAVLRALKNLECKIIVTTRPNYIRFRHFEKNYWQIALEHFNREQRREWLKRYQDCGQTLEEANQTYFNSIGDDATAGICDTPMGLYMVAAGRFDEKEIKNEWAIYRRIFYRELSETEYNQIFQDVSHWHSIQEYRDLLYRVSEEIAWYLYQRDNEDLLVPDSEIKRIIGELDISEGERKTVERCFALCGYWKNNADRGCAEFYHNNIRDFFLCEKLMRELNDAYEQHGDALRNSGDITDFLRRLCELFQYGKLEKTVLFFIRQRAAYSDKEPDLCVKTEREERHTARIFETMLLRGDFYSICEEFLKRENPAKTIARILSNTVVVYRYLYESFLNNGEYIQWWTDVNAVNKDGTFRQLAEQILEHAGSSDLHNADLHNADLHGVDLCRTDLHNADLRRADLHNANLHNADLRKADLGEANLRSADLNKANLRGADLRGADLQGADLNKANLRGADLNGADLNEADLNSANLCDEDLQGANLRGADLQGANLRGEDLRGVDLSGVDLSGMDLRGADLQGEDLRGANLRGANLYRAKLQGADLQGADLQGADLQGADLQGADLNKVNLVKAYLQHANLYGADLQGADLQGTDLRSADLRSADLRGADLQDADLGGADLQGAKGYNLGGTKGMPITD